MKTLFCTLIFLQLFSLSHAQSSIKVKVVGRSKTVSKETIPLTLIDTLSYLKKLSKQRPYEDLNYDYGSEFIPGPRKGALGWQDNTGNFWMFGGIGIDDDYNTGLFQDLWTFNPLKRAWTLVKGDRKVIEEKDFTSKEIPLPRRDAMTWVDKNGDLWLYGGRDFGDNLHYGDMWKFTLKTKTWSNIAGTKEFNVSSKKGILKRTQESNNPGGRSSSVTWTDKLGNLWLMGGVSSNTLNEENLNNDLWQFDVKKLQWTWISGSEKSNAKSSFGKRGTSDNSTIPSPRYMSGGWYEESKNRLWLYGGLGKDTTGIKTGALSDMWVYDINKDNWTWIAGTTKFSSEPFESGLEGEKESSHPGYRIHPLTWKDSKGNFLLFNGRNLKKGDAFQIDRYLWLFDIEKLSWRSTFIPVENGIVNDGCAFIDLDGGLLIFGGEEIEQTWKNLSIKYEI